MIKLSWEDVEKIADELADKIRADGFKPDYIVGITTGGLIPLGLLAKRLKLKNILTISVDSNETIYLPKVDLMGKKVLVIDEIAESGKTLRKVCKKFADFYGVLELKTATLGVNKDKCKFYPDFYVIDEQGEWVIFPWEKEEDFSKYK